MKKILSTVLLMATSLMAENAFAAATCPTEKDVAKDWHDILIDRFYTDHNNVNWTSKISMGAVCRSSNNNLFIAPEKFYFTNNTSNNSKSSCTYNYVCIPRKEGDSTARGKDSGTFHLYEQ
jgi:hypothetical protein